MQVLYESGTALVSPVYAYSLDTDKRAEYRPSPEKKAVLVCMSTLMLFSIQPGSEKVKADTAQSSIITPIVKDQRLNTERADLKIIARIRELGTYPYGWDGVDGKAPSEEAVDEAEKFAWSFLRDEGIEKPIVSLAADGEIAFLWTLPDFRLDLGFYGDSTYSYSVLSHM
jgi:hypothetical protein